jgi:hypothetical protein
MAEQTKSEPESVNEQAPVAAPGEENIVIQNPRAYAQRGIL